MKKRLLSLLVAITLLASMLACFALTGTAATKQEKKRVIGVVFDNSGSMYGDTSKWCRATYGMEVFAAMMNPGDQMMIFPMHDISLGKDGQVMPKEQPLVINGPSEANKIRQIYTPDPSGTPFSTVTTAYENLKTVTADEKYLIILTDGTFDGGMTSGQVSQYLDEYSRDMNVMFLAIGSSVNMPTVTDSAKQLYEKASDSSLVLSKLTMMCNRIFGRKELKVENGKISFDVSMGKIIVFAQGENVSSVTLDGGSLISSYETKYSELGAGGIYENSTVDRALQGMLVTYKDLDAGTYQLSYSGNPKNISVYYEPDVDILVQLINQDGQVVDGGSGMYAGTYTMKYCLVDKYGNPTDSDLLGDVNYDITYTINGQEYTITATESGSKEIELPPDSTLDADFKVRFLEDFSIHKTGQDFGWPFGGINIVPRPVGTVELRVSGGQDLYQMSTLENDAVYRVQLYLDGELLGGDSLKNAQLSFDLLGGNAQYDIKQDSDGYTVSLKYNGEAKSTDCGKYQATFSASYTNEDGQTGTTPEVVKTFEIADDSMGLAAEIVLIQDYYLTYEIDESEPILIYLTVEGAPLTAEQFAMVTPSVDIPGLKFDLQPDATNSMYIVKLSSEGEPETGDYKITFTASGTDEVGRPFTTKDTAEFELANYPMWVKILFWVLLALLIALLVWLYLNAKILPKQIGAGKGTFTVDGDLITGNVRCSYSGKNKKRGTLEITSPQCMTNPNAKCGYRLELEAISPRRTRSSARRAKVVNIIPLNPANTVNIGVGSIQLNRDFTTGKLVKVGSKPDAKIEFNIGNNVQTKVLAEILDVTDGSEIMASLTVPLKFY